MRGTAATSPRAKKSGSMVSRAIPTATTPSAELPTDNSPLVICSGRMVALTMARWRRSWKPGSSKRARSARQAASTTCCVAERATISESSRCTSLRTMVATEATARAATRKTMEGTVEEKSLVVLSASSLVSSCLPMSTCAARAALPTPWRPTLNTSWRRAAAHTSRKAPRSSRGR